MNSGKDTVYSSPSAMEPLLPGADRAGLAELGCEALRATGRLSGLVHSDVVRGKIAALIREIAGKGATVAAEIIKLGLREKLMESPGERGPLRIAFPAKVLPSYFPQLYLDLPAGG